MSQLGQSLQLILPLGRTRSPLWLENRPYFNAKCVGDLPAAHAPPPASQPLHFDYLVRQNSSSFTLVLVHIGSIPKAIEFFLDTPADIPRAPSKLVETLEVGGALGRR